MTPALSCLLGGLVYVCLCRVVGSKVVEEAITNGARTVEDVAAYCGATTDCGRCRRTVEKLLAGRLTDPPSET